MTINKNELENKAKQLLRDTEYFGIMPVDVLQIANILQIEVFQSSLDSMTSGYIKRKNDDTFEIVLRNNDTVERKRFTLAHELGHFILHRSKFNSNQQVHIDKLNRDDNITNIEEMEANYFAGALLMQEENVISLKDAGMKISTMAAEFAVSESAMNVRLAELEEH